MSSENDLSQNIEINVVLNEQSLNETQRKIDAFNAELKKELGLAGSSLNIAVGGYTLNEATTRQDYKAGRKYQKETGDSRKTAGISSTDKAARAREYEKQASELARLFGTTFIPEFITGIEGSVKDFKIPRSLSDQFTKKIEDFMLQGTTMVVSSPAYIAAVERVLAKNPNLEVPNREMLPAANRFGSILYENAKNLRNIKSGSVDEAINDLQSTIRQLEVAVQDGNVALENDLDWARERLTKMKGWIGSSMGGPEKPGEAVYGVNRIPATKEEIDKFYAAVEKFSEAAPENASKLETAILTKVADDLAEISKATFLYANAQLLKNKDYQKMVREDPTFQLGAVGMSDSAQNLLRYIHEDATSFMYNEEAKRGYLPGTTIQNQNLYSAKLGGHVNDLPIGDNTSALGMQQMFKWLNTGAGFIGVKEWFKEALIDPVMQVMADPTILGKVPQMISTKFKKLLSESATPLLGMDRFSSKNDLYEQIASKTSSGFMGFPGKGPQPAAPIGAADPVSAIIAKYEGVLSERVINSIVKLVESAGGDTSKLTAAFDTEFTDGLITPITEAAITVKNGMGKFENILQFAHVPTGTEAAELIAKKFKLTTDGGKKEGVGIKSIQDLQQRAIDRGLDLSKIGSFDPKVNVAEYSKKISYVINILRMFDELGIKIVGSKIGSVDFTQLAKSVSNMKKLAASDKELLDAGVGNINLPTHWENIVDTATVGAKAKQHLSGKAGKSVWGDPTPGLAEMLSGGTTNTELFIGAYKHFNQIIGKEASIFDKAALEQGKPIIGKMGAHFAEVDNVMALIVHSLLEQVIETRAILDKGKSIHAGTNYGTGGHLYPFSRETRKAYGLDGASTDVPQKSESSFGHSVDEQIKQRKLAADAAHQEALEVDNLEKSIVDLNRARVNESEQMQKALNDSVAYRNASNGLAKTLVDIKEITGLLAPNKQSKMYDPEALNKYLQATGLQKKDLFDLRAELYKTADGYEALMEKEKKRYVQNLKDAEISEQGGKMYENLSSTLNRYGGSLRIVAKANGELKEATWNPKELFGPDPVATKNASETIKRALLDEVQAEKDVEKATKASLSQWVTGRYALYDVANAYQNVSRQAFLFARQIFNLSSAYRSYETAFTAVERSMELDFSGQISSAQSLKDAFVKLSEEIPVAFEELARVGTLGAQMGIGASGIVDFTRTVTEFSSVTQISADTVAEGFGRIAQLTKMDPSKFKNLGSAISYAGINAVATESEIVSMTQSIAAASNLANMTTPEIVGMATALASVGVPAEQARGVFTRVFADINRAVALGGKDLETFAKLSGMSAKDFAKGWSTQGESYGVFESLLKGIKSTGNLTKSFDSLGLTETRTVNTLTRLVQNLDVVSSSMDNATTAFDNGTFLGESFGKTLDNLDSQITIFQNNLKSLGEEMGMQIAGPLKDFMKSASQIVNVLKAMSKGTFMQWIAPTALGLTVLVGGFTALTSVMAKVVAQIYAFRVAMIQSATDPTAVASIGSKVKQLLNISSGLIEMRDQLQSPNASVRGEVTPITYPTKLAFKGDAAKREWLLKEHNIMLTSTREEADALNSLIITRRAEIAEIIAETDANTAAGAAKIRAAEAATINYESINGEIKAISLKDQLSLQEQQISKTAITSKQAETAARLANADSMVIETKVASEAGKGALGAGSKIMSVLGTAGAIAGVVVTIWGLVDGIRTAVEEANKIDILGSGGGIASLRDAIKQDTIAWKKDQSSAISTTTSSYKTYSVEVNKAAEAISSVTGASSNLVKTSDGVTESVQNQTVAIGQNTNAWITNSLMGNEKVQGWLKNNPKLIQTASKALAAAGSNLSDIFKNMLKNPNMDPAEILRPIDNTLKSLRQKYAKAYDEWFPTFKMNKGADPGLAFKVSQQGKALLSQIDSLEKIKSAFGDVSGALSAALDQIEFAKMIAGITDGTNAIVELAGAYSDAVKSGKGMGDVVDQVKSATIGMLPSLSKGSNLLKNIDTANSVEGIYKLVKAEKALYIAQQQLLQKDNTRFSETIKLDPKLKQFDTILNSLFGLLGSSKIDTSTKSTETLTDRIKRLIGEATGATDRILGLHSAVRTLGASMKDYAKFDWTPKGETNLSNLSSALKQIGESANGNMKTAVANTKVFKIALMDVGAGSAAIALVDKTLKKLGGTSNLSAKEIAELRKKYSSLLKVFTEDLNKPEEKIRTLTQYVADLRTVIQSAFDFRYGAQKSLDTLTTSWYDLGDSVREAQKAIKNANNEIESTKADKTTLEYQLSVAKRYGDTARVVVIQAKLAELNAKIEEQNKALADAQDAANMSLVGNTKAAIANRAKIMALVTTYDDYLLSLANTGMSQEEINKKAEELSAEFLAQGEALGFNKDELKKYTDGFKIDLAAAVDGVPKNITVNVDTDPALRAIREFVAAANAALAEINTVNLLAPKSSGLPQTPDVAPYDPITGWKQSGGYMNAADFMAVNGSMKTSYSAPNYAPTSSMDSGSQVVYLSPEDRSLLRAAINTPVELYSSDVLLASSTNTGNTMLAKRGLN